MTEDNMKLVFPQKIQRQLHQIDMLLGESQNRITEYENFKYNNTNTPEQKYLKINIELLHLMRRFLIIKYTGNLEDHQRILNHVFAKLFELSHENDRIVTELHELKKGIFGE